MAGEGSQVLHMAVVVLAVFLVEEELVVLKKVLDWWWAEGPALDSAWGQELAGAEVVLVVLFVV